MAKLTKIFEQKPNYELGLTSNLNLLNAEMGLTGITEDRCYCSIQDRELCEGVYGDSNILRDEYVQIAGSRFTLRQMLMLAAIRVTHVTKVQNKLEDNIEKIKEQYLKMLRDLRVEDKFDVVAEIFKAEYIRLSVRLTGSSVDVIYAVYEVMSNGFRITRSSYGPMACAIITAAIGSPTVHTSCLLFLGAMNATGSISIGGLREIVQRVLESNRYEEVYDLDLDDLKNFVPWFNVGDFCAEPMPDTCLWHEIFENNIIRDLESGYRLFLQILDSSVPKVSYDNAVYVSIELFQMLSELCTSNYKAFSSIRQVAISDVDVKISFDSANEIIAKFDRHVLKFSIVDGNLVFADLPLFMLQHMAPYLNSLRPPVRDRYLYALTIILQNSIMDEAVFGKLLTDKNKEGLSKVDITKDCIDTLYTHSPWSYETINAFFNDGAEAIRDTIRVLCN